MADINLALGTQYIAAARRRRRNLYLLAGLIVLLLMGAGLILYAWAAKVEQQLLETQAELNSIEAEISRSGADVARIELFEGRIKTLKVLLDKHISWNIFFDALQQYLPADTVITSIKVENMDNIVDVTGTVGSMEQLSLAIASLETKPDRGTPFSDVNIKSISQKQIVDEKGQLVATKYDFSGEFKLNRIVK